MAYCWSLRWVFKSINTITLTSVNVFFSWTACWTHHLHPDTNTYSGVEPTYYVLAILQVRGPGFLRFGVFGEPDLVSYGWKSANSFQWHFRQFQAATQRIHVDLESSVQTRCVLNEHDKWCLTLNHCFACPAIGWPVASQALSTNICRSVL